MEPTNREVKTIECHLRFANGSTQIFKREIYAGELPNIQILIDFLLDDFFYSRDFQVTLSELREIAANKANLNLKRSLKTDATNVVVTLRLRTVPIRIAVQEMMEQDSGPTDEIDKLFCDVDTQECNSSFVENAQGIVGFKGRDLRA